MPIVIKEIRVNTVVEKKIITHQEISEEIYHKIKNEILEELECHVDVNSQDKRKNNR